MIVPGSASQSLAAALAAETGEELASVVYDSFPDGELIAATPGFDADRAVIVASTISAGTHLEVLQLQDAVREAGAREVITVLPYMGYARQDDAHDPSGQERSGFPISARAVARALSVGTDRIITVNPHEQAVTTFFDVPAEALDAAPRLANPLPDDLIEPLFLAPDEGAIGLAGGVRDAYGGGQTDHFEKTRLSSDTVEIAPSDATAAERDIVVVDDIVATGSTMSESITHLADQGPERIFVACIHPVFAGEARTTLARAGVEAIVATDTIERSVTAVSVAPILADAL